MSIFKTAWKRSEIRFDLPLTSCGVGLRLLKNAKMFAQRVYGVCQSQEDCNVFDHLKEDPLFDRFYRVDSSRLGETGGTGLAICKGIADLAAGRPGGPRRA